MEKVGALEATIEKSTDISFDYLCDIFTFIVIFVIMMYVPFIVEIPL